MAFENLYRRFGPAVFQAAERVLQNGEDAADVLQETFLIAYRRIETYRAEGSLQAWLGRIAVRCALRFRSRRRAELVFDETGAEALYAPPESACDQDFEALVHGEIRRLPERARRVLQLYLQGEHTHAQIAGRLGISEGTSKSQLSYARSLLRKRLLRWHPELLGTH